jgi:DNA-binding CsgD family transcriptional regulator
MLESGRAAFAKEAWSDAYTHLTNADAQTPLDPDDLERLAIAAYLIGQEEASIAALSRAHSAFLERGEKLRAVTSAYWLVFSYHDKPAQRAQGSGWLARARRLLDDVTKPCVEEGWVTSASAFERIMQGDIPGAHQLFTEAAEIGVRFGNRDLTALARHGQGRTLLFMNRTSEGLSLIDEVMVSITGGEVGPIVSGVVYCSVLSACHELFDLRRAQEWTMALDRWCTAHPDLVAFRGQCLIRRSQLIQLHGEWEDALVEAQRARDRLTAPRVQPEAGLAHYQLAELYRLRGEFGKAEDSYRHASQAGRNPSPGLALLRLAQGHADAADSAIRLALGEVRNPRPRVDVLSAAVEIMLARQDHSAARDASAELSQLAVTFDAPFVRALAAQASGAIALAESQHAAALGPLREACAIWQELDAPYQLARIRVLVGLAYRDLGDRDGAMLEFEAAQEIFERLGAAPDATRLDALTAHASVPEGGLTGREVEVLRLVATGATNRAIATRLGISEKTVARHVSNIFTKLDLSSRAAATAYAFQHKLI